MKRFVSLVLALSMVLSLFPAAFAADSLSDIKGSKYEAAVDALMELGVVSGYPDGTYLPDNVLLRSELTKLLVTSYGLDLAAKSSMGVTPYEDVNSVGNHWASGYINVSADYKFVNGYPDGSFKPDNPVTYAEAITMCLRVLGYANEIESRGTWPTNYIAKAQDLKLMKDISFNSYDDGAKRGDVAILIWNMLRTKMWTVNSESEGDGLVYRPDEIMLNVKFSDYRYSKDAKFKEFSIAEDKDNDVYTVFVILDHVYDSKTDSYKDNQSFKYAKNDFYKFVPGTEVEILANVEDEELLTMVPTSNNKLIEGNKIDIDDDGEYVTLKDKDYEYVYASTSDDELEEFSALKTVSIYVDEFEEEDKYVRINGEKFNDKDTNKWVILSGDDRISIRDIEVGDIITAVLVANNAKGLDKTLEVSNDKFNTDASRVFYIVGGTEAEGELTEYVQQDYKPGKTIKYNTITVDEEEYMLDKNATYVEDPEDDDVKAEPFYKVSSTKVWDEDMKNENVVLKLDPILGRVVRVEFDGEINGGDADTSAGFFGINDLPRRGDTARDLSIELTALDGTPKEYSFTKSAAKDYVDGEDDANIDLMGTLAFVEFNEDEEIEKITVVAKANEDTPDNPTFKADDYTKTAKNGKVKVDYKAELWDTASYYEKRNTLYKDEDTKDDGIKVASDVVVAVLTYDEDEDECVIEFVEDGLDTIKSLDEEEKVGVIIDQKSKTEKINFVVLFDEATDVSDMKVSSIDHSYKNEDAEEKVYLEEEEKAYRVEDEEDLSDKEVVVYKLKEGSKETTIEYVDGLTKAQLEGTGLVYVQSADEDDVKYGKYADGTTFDFGDSDYDNALFVLVRVDADGKLRDCKIVANEDVEIKDYDRILDNHEDSKVVFIVRGLEKDSSLVTEVAKVEVTNAEDFANITSMPEAQLEIKAKVTSTADEDITAKVKPTFTCDKEDFITVDTDGKVTLKANGTTKVTVKAGGKETELTVTVEITPRGLENEVKTLMTSTMKSAIETALSSKYNGSINVTDLSNIEIEIKSSENVTPATFAAELAKDKFSSITDVVIEYYIDNNTSDFGEKLEDLSTLSDDILGSGLTNGETVKVKVKLIDNADATKIATKPVEIIFVFTKEA